MRGAVATRVLLLATILPILSGCASVADTRRQPSQAEGAYDNPRTWLLSAQRHESEGDLQQALYDYRLAKTVGADRREIEGDLRRVEARIERRCDALLKKADKAAARGKARTARNLYLEILGLKPDHPAALAALREQDQRMAMQGMEKKRVLAGRNRRHGRPRAQRATAYTDEGYSYSRQGILDASAHASESGQLIEKLQRHLENYPNDAEMRRLLIKTCLQRAQQRFQADALDDALAYLSSAEQASRGEKGLLGPVLKARKGFARALYDQGVISYRKTPQQALESWRYALRFDPQDEKSRLRIRSLLKGAGSER
jgi:tetratricopeptide (TPR) repeat protein